MDRDGDAGLPWEAVVERVRGQAGAGRGRPGRADGAAEPRRPGHPATPRGTRGIGRGRRAEVVALGRCRLREREHRPQVPRQRRRRARLVPAERPGGPERVEVHGLPRRHEVVYPLGQEHGLA